MRASFADQVMPFSFGPGCGGRPERTLARLIIMTKCMWARRRQCDDSKAIPGSCRSPKQRQWSLAESDAAVQRDGDRDIASRCIGHGSMPQLGLDSRDDAQTLWLCSANITSGSWKAMNGDGAAWSQYASAPT